MKKLITILLISFSFYGNSQVIITDNQPIVDMVKRLEGDGVLIENITFSFDLETQDLYNPIGTFWDTVGALGMENGILMTNGAARNARGPNNRSDIDQANYPDIYIDNQLQELIADNQELRDLVIIEFDITVYSNQLAFNYVFASEEYPEFLEFNDVFGFFLSGPGIVGTENLAVIPGSSAPVSVSNINQNVNDQFFISNGTGETPFDSKNLQYDGYTVVLEAQREVIPCETYHIKLAIADVDDSNLDSGVFLEEGSFKSKKLPYFDVFYEHPRFDNLIEGCNNAQINIVRDLQDLGSTAQFEILVEGTAIQGIDFESIPLVFTFGPDDLFKSFNLNTIIDNIDEPFENIKLTLLSDCDKFDFFDIIEIPLREKFEENLPALRKCGPNAIVLNENALATDYFTWNENDLLSCLDCNSPLTDVLQDTSFNFDVIDSISGCSGFGSQKLEYVDIVADFDFVNDYCNTSIEYDFINKSKGAIEYLWDFGDNNTSTDLNPTHLYQSAEDNNDQFEYNVSLTVSNNELGCVNVKREKIFINEPLFLPNIVTPNGDLINDIFQISGINEDCWSIEIYNRWGKLVLEENPIQNQFTPNNLSDGVYYYRVVNTDENRELKGYFNLLK